MRVWKQSEDNNYDGIPTGSISLDTDQSDYTRGEVVMATFSPAGIREPGEVPVYRVDISPSTFGGASWSGTICCNRCYGGVGTCLPVFPYDWAESGGVNRFMFFMNPAPNLAFLLWVKNEGECPISLQPTPEYSFPPNMSGGSIDIFGFYDERLQHKWFFDYIFS